MILYNKHAMFAKDDRTMSKCRLVLATLAIALAGAAPEGAKPRFDAKSIEYFEKNVRPLLVANCYTCHSASTNSKGGLRVDDRNGLIQGGDRGPAVVPGDPQNSLLIQAVSHKDDTLKMPPKKRLSADDIATLTRWVESGAAWPDVEASAVLSKSNPKYEKLRKEHWAWQPLKVTSPPSVLDTSWPRSEIDRFLLAQLEKAGLEPVADADRVTLIRRLTFDLTGLPPSPAEIDAFAADRTREALEHVVDRLLASPAYGERWGRHWLDVARYGESTGSSRNLPFPHAWRYRDYVIDAFTEDKPFNTFIKEQLAGDLLPANSPGERDQHLIATGFLAVGVKDVNQRFKVRFIMDNVDEQIDAVGRSFLATTVSCARCHDHKFDPIPTAEYYGLAGIFRSTDLCAGLRNKMGGGGLDYYDTSMLISLSGGPKPDPALSEKIARATAAYEAAKREFEAIRGTPAGLAKGPDGFPKQRPFRLKMVKLEAELAALKEANLGPIALGVRDAKKVEDTQIRLRGEAEKLGPVVPRGFLSILPVPDAPPINRAQSGRLELAEWISSDQNPLTPRVIVNRVWHHLFGQGLVRSVDNFGVTGDVPSHPALLDFLSAQFVRDGWSVKKLVRTLVLTRAYGLSSESNSRNREVDPSNRFVWRHSPRRLDAEEIRDLMLAAGGNLDLNRPLASPAKDLKVIELPNNGPLARKLADAARSSRHRSIYLPLLRTVVPTALEVFDFAEQATVTGKRDTTTVATQALYLLNDPFVRRQALAFGRSLLAQSDCDESRRIDAAYRIALGRGASHAEVERARRFLDEFEQTARTSVPPAVAASPAPKVPPIVTAEVQSARPGNAKPAMPPVNPDEVVPVEGPIAQEVVDFGDARTAAWASLCQALLGSAEVRYLK
jgi:cytochrome c553